MNTPDPSPCTTVLYDGSCPLCSREIRMYQQLQARSSLQWVDVSKPDQTLPAGVTQHALMARFHVMTAQGQLLDGARAFVHMWRQLPGWRWLAWLASIPGVVMLMEGMYRAFLWIRPWIRRIRLQPGDRHV